jgi:hypothetical protein
MLRAIAASGILGCTALTAGCADLMQQSYISQIAPEWFEAKAVEVKGEGYPELADVPEVRKAESTLAQSDEGATALKDAATKLEAQLAAQGVIRSDDEVRATAARWRATLEGGAEAAGHKIEPPPTP